MSLPSILLKRQRDHLIGETYERSALSSMRVGLALAGYNLPNTTIVFLENIMMIVLQSGHYTI